MIQVNTDITAPIATSRPREEEIDEFEISVPSPPELMKRRAKKHVGFIIGGTVVVLVLILAVFAPVIAPSDPYDQTLTNRLLPPIWHEKGSWSHPFGTDALGRDYFSRVIFGARISLMIGFFAAAVSAVVGSALGMVGGYFGGKTDAVVMYLINVKFGAAGPPRRSFLGICFRWLFNCVDMYSSISILGPLCCCNAFRHSANSHQRLYYCGTGCGGISFTHYRR